MAGSQGVLSLQLKQEFREPLKSGGFVGREAEVARLASLLANRTAATVLVSGHRGTGKSSLVDEAIRQVGSSNKKRRLVARLALPHLQSTADLRGQLLRSLARALFFSVREAKGPSKKLKERAEALYQKTYLREIEEHSVLESIAQSEARSTTRERTETTHDLSKVGAVITGSVLALAGTIGGIATISNVVQQYGARWGLASALGIVLVTAIAGTTIMRAKEHEESVADNLTKLDRRSQTGQLDVSPDTLEFELRDLIQDFKAAGYPWVFVVDELDKLDVPVEPDPSLQHHPIFKIIASLKNFFTLGYGIFVFISGEDFYRQLEDTLSNEDYSLAHTLFTDRIFIHALHHESLERLIDGMMYKKPPQELKYRKYRNYLCWESRNHVFDLLSLINDFVVFDERGRPFVQAEMPGPRDGRWREGNLPTNWEDAAALQKVTGAAYDESARPAAKEELFNQYLWRLLRHVGQRLLDKESISLPNNEYSLPGVSWLPQLSHEDGQDLIGAVERFLKKLERYGLVESTERTPPPAVQPGQTSSPEAITTMYYRLVDKPNYPPASVGTEAQLIPIEETYVEFAQRIDQMVVILKDLEFNLDAFDDAIAGTDQLAGRLKATTPRTTVPRSQVSQGFVTAQDLASRLVSFGIKGEVEEWAADVGAARTESLTEIEARTGETWETSLKEFPEVVSALSRSAPLFQLVGSSTNENQLLVLVHPNERQVESISRAYANSLSKDEKERERRRLRLPVVVVQVIPSGEKVELPQEAVEVFDDASAVTLLRAFFGGEPEKTFRQRDVLGWNVFALDPLLNNLKDLQPLLSEVSYVGSQPGQD